MEALHLVDAAFATWRRDVKVRIYRRSSGKDSLAEWSKALAPGASPQGRGFEPHSCHL